MGDERQHRPEDGHLRASVDYKAPGSAHPHPDREGTPAESGGCGDSAAAGAGGGLRPPHHGGRP